MIVIERDLCVSKQMKDNIELFVFQRLFQQKKSKYAICVWAFCVKTSGIIIAGL